jgi:hypothetical protein
MDSALDFVDELNDGVENGPGVATTEAKERILQAHIKLNMELLR